MSANALGLGGPRSPRALLGDLRCRLSATRRPNENDLNLCSGADDGSSGTTSQRLALTGRRIEGGDSLCIQSTPGCAVRPRAKVPSSTVANAASEIIESSTILPAALGDGQALGIRRPSKEFPSPRRRKPAPAEKVSLTVSNGQRRSHILGTFWSTNRKMFASPCFRNWGETIWSVWQS